MATYISDKSFREQVRVCLDENRSINTEALLQDIDTLSLDEIIDSKVEDAALSVIKAAPVTKLGDISQSIGETPVISRESPHNGEVALPNDFERLVRFKMKSWKYALFAAQPPFTPQWEMAHSGFNAYGTKDRPQIFLVPSELRGKDLKLEFFCAGSKDDELDGCLYVAKPKKRNADGENTNTGGENANAGGIGSAGSAGNYAGNTGGNNWSNVNGGTSGNTGNDTNEENLPYVDLGLPSGTMWAKCNVGAESPENYGSYFAWGETGVKSEYSTSNYSFTGNTELESVDDAAFVNVGPDWRMPNDEQVNELLQYTTKSVEMLGDVRGYLFTSRINGKSIFLPLAGSCINSSPAGYSIYGRYWLRLPDSDQTLSKSLFIGKRDGKDKAIIENYLRSYGLSIRPVYVPSGPRQKPIRVTDTEETQTHFVTGDRWDILLGDDLVRPTIYYAAYLTALEVKDADAAAALQGIAKDMLEN